MTEGDLAVWTFLAHVGEELAWGRARCECGVCNKVRADAIKAKYQHQGAIATDRE